MGDQQVLCVHGGLSPDIRSLDQIRLIERNQEIPHKGAFCDLVWSDPEEVDNWAVSPRGAGWLFGPKVTAEFMTNNNLKLICRAHQLVHEGYKYMFNDSLVTVWSAPTTSTGVAMWRAFCSFLTRTTEHLNCL